VCVRERERVCVLACSCSYVNVEIDSRVYVKNLVRSNKLMPINAIFYSCRNQRAF
jgi:hypothetical protein